MNLTADIKIFRAKLRSFRPEKYAHARALALYSAAVAFGDSELLSQTIKELQKFEVTGEHFYEVTLQSYLFLGFPRMLEAADVLNRYYPLENAQSHLRQLSPAESETWFENGMNLCQRVYGDNYEPLKRRVESIAPEIFRWMIIEGYGKVLSRPELPAPERELAIIAFLMIENRDRQLHSHIRGALNVGCSIDQVGTVVEDIGEAAGDGYKSANEIMEKVRA